MAEKNETDMVPEQETGVPINTESSVELGSEQEAKGFFEVVKKRLQHVSHWHEIAGSGSATFQLIDKNGLEVQRTPEKGDYFKIEIPGPGNAGGDGYDWVEVEEVDSTSSGDGETYGFRVRPTEDPRNREHIAHFYSRETTSSFVVTREKNKITAAVYDRNTKPNKEAGPIANKVRDVVVGTAGILGFSKIQWKKLTDGLLDPES